MSTSHYSLKRPSRRRPLAARVAAILALSAPVAVHAATKVVTNCSGDDTLGGLHWAAAATGNGDTIDMTNITDFSACLPNADGFAQVILLSSTVTLATGVTINGPNATGTNLAVSGLNNFRVFSSPGTLTINDLGVVNGKNTIPNKLLGTYGGCTYSHSDTTLTNVVLDHCTTSGPNSMGGAVATYDGSVTLTNSRITHGYATSNGSASAWGGAVCAWGDAILQHSYIDDSTASATGANAFGGGVWANGNVKLQYSAVAATHAVSMSTNVFEVARGGGVYAVGKVTLNHARVEDSTTYAKGHDARGGGIYSKGLTDARYSVVVFNEAQGAPGVATKGGGIYSQGGLTAQYSNVSYNNSANGEGGGVVVAGGNSYVRGSTVAGNNASVSIAGVGFFSGGTTSVDIINSTISGNNSLGSAAAGYIKAYKTTINNSTIAYNHGASGSGVVVYPGIAGSTIDLNSTLISGNTYGAGNTNNDLFTNVSFTAVSGNNLIRTPQSGVPPGTLTGVCPLLHALRLNGGPMPTHRLGGGISAAAGSKNPAIDVGSNPLSLGSDQRGGSTNATSPPRVSGIAADIGAYEVDQSDIIFDAQFEGCQ